MQCINHIDGGCMVVHSILSPILCNHGQIHPLLDSINLMTYDFYTAGPNPGHHTNLYPSQHDPKNSGHQAVRTFIEAGVTAEKIILGAAFYGRGWSGLKSDESPFGQKSQSGLSNPYSRICTDILTNPKYRRYWDDAAKAPYLWNGDTFITYEDPESLHHKVEYVKDNGLGGIMFWEWSEDKDNALLDALWVKASTFNLLKG